MSPPSSGTKQSLKSIIFWDMTPYSLLSCNRRVGATYLQGRRNNVSKNQQVSGWQAYLLVLAEIISSILKMETICSSGTLVATQQTTRRHIPEDDTLHNHRCENLKSYEAELVLLTACFILDLFLDPEDRGDMFLCNVGGHLPDYLALYPKRHNSS
jgi:hypothetical protein